jgi:hypothetical protein
MKKIIEKYKEASEVAQPSVPWLADSVEALSEGPLGAPPPVPRVPRLLEVFSEVLLFLGKLDTSYEDELSKGGRPDRLGRS